MIEFPKGKTRIASASGTERPLMAYARNAANADVRDNISQVIELAATHIDVHAPPLTTWKRDAAHPCTTLTIQPLSRRT